jgi:hypothetical protein
LVTTVCHFSAGRAGANARKAQDKQKAISILAKLGAARDDDESGSDAAVGSASDQSEDESGSEDDGSGMVLFFFFLSVLALGFS